MVCRAAVERRHRLLLGVSLVLIGPVPLLRRIGVSERLAFTVCGLALVVVSAAAVERA